ncbi:response regulator transcription factor [Paenibacillus sp. N1-5-1-14]|uniref:response regulator transcription factor n=1 Tax=Paenibacillus radicibacter TaxID=2972488 RepID=UPI002158F10B|nr:response regulator transcription factor [Paenibacillus radicibacter]MCR8643141.1 response regulator transcription factor [Paenibacillus radicibacter]
MSKILIVEDETKIARVLQLELQYEGYEVGHAEDGRKGLEMAQGGDWDLILLDIMLPELSGLEVLRRVRQTNTTVPVILLTARDAVPDRVSGLDQGANDYVTKPFAIEELLARIRNLLRITTKITSAESDQYLTVDDLQMNPRSREVTRAGNSIELTPKEFELLHYLVEHKGEVRTREDIISDVWGYDFVGDTNIVDVYIRYLRQKIEKGFPTKIIHTLRGVGYLIKDSDGNES